MILVILDIHVYFFGLPIQSGSRRGAAVLLMHSFRIVPLHPYRPVNAAVERKCI